MPRPIRKRDYEYWNTPVRCAHTGCTTCFIRKSNAHRFCRHHAEQRLDERQRDAQARRREKGAQVLYRMWCGHCRASYDGRRGDGMFCTAACSDAFEPQRLAQVARDAAAFRRASRERAERQRAEQERVKRERAALGEYSRLVLVAA